jgi:hypothetical protein
VTTCRVDTVHSMVSQIICLRSHGGVHKPSGLSAEDTKKNTPSLNTPRQPLPQVSFWHPRSTHRSRTTKLSNLLTNPLHTIKHLRRHHHAVSRRPIRRSGKRRPHVGGRNCCETTHSRTTFRLPVRSRSARPSGCEKRPRYQVDCRPMGAGAFRRSEHRSRRLGLVFPELSTRHCTGLLWGYPHSLHT